MKKFFLFFFFCSCSSVEINKGFEKNLDFSVFKKTYCSIHFCFYSNENLPLVDISTTAQNVFYYFSLNYSFNTIDEYPYNLVVVSSTSSYSKDFLNSYDVVYYSTTNSCMISDSVTKAIVDDIFDSYKNNFSWLYYGFLEYVSSQFCPKKNLIYLNLLSKEENRITLDNLFYIDPKKISHKKAIIYYANVYNITKFLIDNYSYYRFSLFINELMKTGDLKSSSLNVFGEDIFFILKKRLI